MCYEEGGEDSSDSALGVATPLEVSPAAVVALESWKKMSRVFEALEDDVLMFKIS